VTAAAQAVSVSKKRGAAREVSHNLNGQRLGRKGRDTRDRIIAAANEILAEPRGDAAMTLSEVARRSGLRMATLYIYFADMTELMLAILEPVMAEAQEAYLKHLDAYWPDDALYDHCYEFVLAFHAFWQRHTRILHYRNSISDQQDKRMMAQRVEAATRIIGMIMTQMGHDRTAIRSEAAGMATVLYTGIERVIVVATDQVMPTVLPGHFSPNVENFLKSEAKLLEFGIRQYRALAD
jgi:AcrR family transcriptional regulator